MRKALVILVDGLPFWKRSSELTPFLDSLPAAPLEPGLGFSINLYPEMLAGKQPDDLGFFNKWKLREPLQEPGPPARMGRRVLDVSRVSFPGSRVLHKLLEPLTGPTGNVPFRYLPYFELNPKREVFDGAPYPTVFDHGSWRKIVASFDKQAGVGRRDAAAVAACKDVLDSGDNVFLLLADLDATAHARGIGSAFDRHLRQVDTWCRELVDRWQQCHGPGGAAVIMSDHGMAKVDPDGVVTHGLERRFGGATAASFVYMLESVMLRVWVRDPTLHEPIRAYLESLDFGFLMTNDERRRHGIATPGFGDLIFMLDEGKVFYPNFFGGRRPKAVHGYDPRCSSQHGVVACTEDVPLPPRSADVYPFLLSLLGAGSETVRA